MFPANRNLTGSTKVAFECRIITFLSLTKRAPDFSTIMKKKCPSSNSTLLLRRNVHRAVMSIHSVTEKRMKNPCFRPREWTLRRHPHRTRQLTPCWLASRTCGFVLFLRTRLSSQRTPNTKGRLRCRACSSTSSGADTETHRCAFGALPIALHDALDGLP